MFRFTSCLAVLVVLVGLGQVAAASQVTVGGYTLDSAVFADTLVDADGYYTILYDPPEPGWATSPAYYLPGLPAEFDQTEDATTGHDVSDSVEIHDGWLLLGFSAPLPFNGPGDDIVVFELSGSRTDNMHVTINGTKLLIQTYFTGETTPNGDLNIATGLIDFDSFGVPANATISSIQIHEGVEGGFYPQEPDIAAVAALNSVPEPSTLALLACGLVAGLLRRRRR